MAFLGITDDEGVRNGKKLNEDYSPRDPETWGDLEWSGYEEKRIKVIKWCDQYGYIGLHGHLDVSGCDTLRTLHCYDGKLTGIDVSGCNNLQNLRCEINYLRFSSLPLLPLETMDEYRYQPQKRVTIGSEGKVLVGEEINLSMEAKIDGYDTEFIWLEQDGQTGDYQQVNPGTAEGGKFTFDQSFVGKTLYCKMTNERFPGLTLRTNNVECVED